MNSKARIIFFLLASFICVQLFACAQENEVHPIKNQRETENMNTMKLKITFGASSFSATLENNVTTSAFIKQLPLILKMNELHNNEKHADLKISLPSDAADRGTILNGDLMLYGSNTLVLFYKTFSTSYNYTKIGKISDPTGLAEALGSGNVIITFEVE